MFATLAALTALAASVPGPGTKTPTTAGSIEPVRTPTIAASRTETSTAAVLPSPRVELVTIGPGGYLYSYWGHAAIRVLDPRDTSDTAYNFGGIDLDGGLVDMMRGHLRGYMYKTTFAELLATYSGEDRTITRRVLALHPLEAKALADRLKALAAEERTYYAYHHFYDNCATRVAEELDRATLGTLRLMGKRPAAGTFRSRVLRPIREHLFLYVALDLAYSKAVDRPLTDWDTTFLPASLATFVDRATLGGKRVVVGENDLFHSIGFDDETPWTWPWAKVYLLFALPLCLLSLVRPRLTARIFGLVSGVVGVLLAIVWMGTSFDFFQGNWNLAVLPPTHLLLVAGWSRPGGARLRTAYLVLHAIAVLTLLALWQAGIIAQAIGPSLGLAVPLALFLAWRNVTDVRSSG